MAIQTLPIELRHLVKDSVTLLGEVIRQEAGEKSYLQIEKIRKRMADLRNLTLSKKHQELILTLQSLKHLSEEGKLEIVHAFSIMLELMNACENAYRTFRLQTKAQSKIEKKPEAIIYILTAHPTEARSPENIFLFQQVQKTLVGVLNQSERLAKLQEQKEILRHLLLVLWKVSVARQRKPSVEDEALHIYSSLLRNEILTVLIKANTQIAPIYIRTWVGGDKDGHPGVNEYSMLNSMNLARARLLPFIRGRIAEVRKTLRIMSAVRLQLDLFEIERALQSIKLVRSGDGARIKLLKEKFLKFSLLYKNEIGSVHPALEEIVQISRLFPGMIVPLELRESSDIIRSAAQGKSTAIQRMLEKLSSISSGGDPKWYAAGLIISMANSMKDIEAACKIVRKSFGRLIIPVIPLFEQKQALLDAPNIISKMIASPSIKKAIRLYWNGSLEMMLGYSDSAKESGVLDSRLTIKDTIYRLDALTRRHGIRPLFFHGSGGSVDRGGGTIEEQTAWWPLSALCTFKATLQGEMIERTLASPEIAYSQFWQIGKRIGEVIQKHHLSKTSEFVYRFTDTVRTEYIKKVSSSDFMDLVQKATAYRYLNALRIGSRPSKRGKIQSVTSLRAIPWVLCWTQTRVLFPTWWGVGKAWKETKVYQKRALTKAFKTEPLFRSYVKALGFTLAKVELAIWRIYLEYSGLDSNSVRVNFEEFETEYSHAVSFVRAMSGCEQLVWFRPWLGTSINLRSAMIHPLNLIQILNLHGDSPWLIRETVTGIASGMMTTG